jgi:hypothetical protein
MAQKTKERVAKSSTSKELLSFIKDTQAGKYTSQKPEVVQVTYRRLKIQEQDKSCYMDTNNGDVVLFGVSY